DSVMASANSLRVLSSPATLPAGWRSTLETPLHAESIANFAHSSLAISVEQVASMPAFLQAARKRSPRALLLPSASPQTMRAALPTGVMTPGDATLAPPI